MVKFIRLNLINYFALRKMNMENRALQRFVMMRLFKLSLLKDFERERYQLMIMDLKIEWFGSDFK